MRLRLECKLQNLWIGIRWEKQIVMAYTAINGAAQHETLHIWICIIPCISIHIIRKTITRTIWKN